MFVFTNSTDLKQNKCNCLIGFTCPVCNPSKQNVDEKKTEFNPISKEELDAGSKSNAPATEAPLQNDINIKYAGNYCPNFCGAYGEPELLQKHEKICPKIVVNVLCLIDQCNWKGPKDNLIKHVCEEHFKDLLVIYPNRKVDIPLKFTSSYKLVVMFPKSYPYNELYWMRLYEQDNELYFMVQYFGHIGERMVSFKGPKEYILNMRDISYTHKIEDFNEDEQESITNTLFMTANGMKIGKNMDQAEYFFTLKGLINEPSLDKITEILRCNMCKKLRRPPFNGSVKHCGLCDTSFSFNPAVTVQSTPHQSIFPGFGPPIKPINVDINGGDWKNLLEKLSLNIEYNCTYTKQGCLEFVTEGNTHEAICSFKTVRCIMCCAEVGRDKLIDHIKTSCPSKSIQNGSTINISVEDKIVVPFTNKYYLIAFEHTFEVNIDLLKEDNLIKIAFTQVLKPVYDDFWINVQVIGDGMPILNTFVFCRPTGTCYFSKNYKNMELKITAFKLLEKTN